MRTIQLTVETRTKMARALAAFLKDHQGFEIKHTTAIQAVAALFGLNEHSLAAHVRNGGIEVRADGEKKSERPPCSVPDCSNLADVEVRLYDIYPYQEGAQIFDERDFTCPFLCAEHVAENERTADGERKPRGFIRYKYSNGHGAQGFSVYRYLPRPPRGE
jgi:hypothetical protein